MQLILVCISFASYIHSTYASNKKMSGFHMRIAAFNNPPYGNLTLKPDGNYTGTGPNFNTHEWLSKKFNYTFSIVDPVIDPDMIAKYGFFELALVKLDKNEADMMIGTLLPTIERVARLDFTSMAWTEPFTIISPKPQQKSRLFAFILPFQPTVWLCLLISVIIFIATMSFFSLTLSHENTNPVKQQETQNSEKNNVKNSKFNRLINIIGYCVIYIVNILTNHGIYSPFAQHSFRILAGSWLLAALVLVNSYSSIVVSSLTVPTMEPAINTFEDLANSKDVSVLLSTDVLLSKIILDATTGVFKILADKVRKNRKERLFVNYLTIYEKFETGHFAHAFQRTYNRRFIIKQFKKDGKCHYQLSPPLQMSTGYYCYPLRKNSPHTSTLSHGLTQLWETGLFRYWMESDISKANQCFDQNKKPMRTSIQNPIAIKIEDLMSAFFILGIGIGMGSVVFLVEVIMTPQARLQMYNP